MDYVHLLDEIEANVSAHLSFENLVKIRETPTPPAVSTFYGEIGWKSMMEVLDVMGVDEAATMLDVGCGGGRWLVAALASGCKNVNGIEYLQQRAEIARESLKDKATVIVGDASDPDHWRSISPTHVVMYDKAHPQSARRSILDAALLSGSVRVVASWREDPVPGFSKRQVIDTFTWPTRERFRCFVSERDPVQL